MSGKGSGSQTPSTQDDTNLTGRADNYVPIFSGNQREYREFRKRCEIYKAKMEIAGRIKETTFNIVTILTGRAWDLVEDMETTELDSFETVFARLDSGFRYDPLTELPDDFESFFIKLQRGHQRTLHEFSADFQRAERQVLAWWFVRKSGVTKEQRQIVLSSV